MLSRLSLRTKLTTLVLIVVAIGCNTVGQFMSKGIIDVYQQLFGQRTETAAVFLSKEVNVDWFKSETPVERLVQSNDYDQLQTWIHSMIAQHYVDRVEIVRFLGNGSSQHIMGVGGYETTKHPLLGSVIETQPDDFYAQSKNDHAALEIYGRIHQAGWAVVQDHGRPIGMVIVLIDATATQGAFDNTQLIILVAMGVITVLCGLVAYRFASSFEKTAVTDGLMQLYNQRYFKQRLDQEVSRAARHKHPLALVMLDIDHFKKVNDTYGHATGDIVLRLLGRLAKEQVRKTDVAARYGGEEIAIILTDTALAGAQLFAERLREFVASQTVRDPEEAAVFQITVSIGCAQWERGMSYLDLIRAADTALYHSKNAGRNRVSVYHEDLLPRPEKQNVVKQRA